MGITLDISEGNKYYIRNVSWIGNSVYETDELARMFGVEKARFTTKIDVQAPGHRRLLQSGRTVHHQSPTKIRGYLTSQIDPAEIIIGKDSIDLEVPRIRRQTIHHQQCRHFGQYAARRRGVIRRELYTRPGELYNQSLLFQTIRTLGSMGHFTAEAIAPDRFSPSSIRTDWSISTGRSRRSPATSSRSPAVGAAVRSWVRWVSLNNLSIKNFFKKGAWRPYPMGRNQRLSISAQTNIYYKAFAISFTDPWMGGRKPNSFTISAHYSIKENNAYYAWQKGTRYFRTAGVAAGLGKRLDWPDPYFTFYAEASYERYMLKDWNTFVLKNGAANLLSIRLVLGPEFGGSADLSRRGSDFNVSVQLLLLIRCGTAKDYKSTALSEQERYNWIEFHKWMLKGQWFLR